MTNSIIINGGSYVPIESIRRIRALTDEDRASLAERGNNVNAEKFNTRLEFSYRRQTLAEETVDEIASKGLTLVQIDDESFVPKNNIIKAKNLTEQDRAAYKERTGRDMRPELKSQVETVGGNVLSKSDAQEVMTRLSRPYQPVTANPVPDQPEFPPWEERDVMLQRAAKERLEAPKPKGKKQTKKHVPTQ